MVAWPSPWWTGVRYVWTLGLWELWRKRQQFIITNQRVIMRQGLVFQRSTSVPLDRIQDVDVTTSVLGGATIMLSSAGGLLGTEQIGPLTRDEGARFANTLQQAIFNTQGPYR